MTGAKEVEREITTNYLREMSMFFTRVVLEENASTHLIAVVLRTQMELKWTTDENRLRGPLGSQKSKNNFVGQGV